MEEMLQVKYKNQAAKLSEYLNLSRKPVAMRFLRKGEEVPGGYRSDMRLTYCQFVMMAERGEHLLANAANVSCANGAAALGLIQLPEKIASGAMHAKMNVCETAEAAASISASTPRIEFGSFESIILAPLAEAEFEPDVVIVQGAPFSLIWIIMADNYKRGKRYNFSTAVSQGICVDATVVPFKTGELNLTMGCYGSRNATDEENGEVIIGIPFDHLDNIIANIPGFEDNILGRGRNKPALKRLQEKLEQ